MILSVYADLKTKETKTMAKQYKGSLSLDWYNKQKSILLRGEEDVKLEGDIPAPKINWINKDEALFYEVDEKEGKGLSPYWVDRTDIRVKEARPLLLQKIYKAVEQDKEWAIEESTTEDPTVENILIKGDNLLALNTLKKMFDNKAEEERVKCVFIDPPYNTGHAFQQYDDNLEMSEWLSMFRDRLNGIYDLMGTDAFIWVTLDDNAIFHAKLLMDDIFGKANFLGNIIWQHSLQSKGYEGKFSIHHNYILCYKKNEEIKLGLDEREDKHNVNYSNPDNDPNGDWRSGDVRNSLYRPNLIYDIKTPSGKIISPPDNGWRWSKETVNEKISTGEIIFSVDETRIIRKIYLKNQEGRVPESIWFDRDLDELPESFWYGENVGTTRVANKEIKELFGYKIFDTPKPEKLIKKILNLCTEEGDLVFDSFGGSGTTFAVAHKMNRKWIGIEIGSHADDVIVPRLQKVISYNDRLGISEEVNWQGGGSFKYYHLGESIIKVNEDGTGDFNWSLGRSYIEEAFLSSYDYTLDTILDLAKGFIFGDNQVPLIGIQQVGSKTRVAIVSLNAPDEDNSFMTYDEIFYLYQQVKKHLNPQYLNVFTNRGVEIAYDSKPEDLEVVKIPQAIFAELEK